MTVALVLVGFAILIGVHRWRSRVTTQYVSGAWLEEYRKHAEERRLP